MREAPKQTSSLPEDTSGPGRYLFSIQIIQTMLTINLIITNIIEVNNDKY